jgi:hypothetical protein
LGKEGLYRDGDDNAVGSVADADDMITADKWTAPETVRRRWLPSRLKRTTPWSRELALRNGHLPADDKLLATVTKLSATAWGALRDKLLMLGLVRVENGMWIDDDQERSLEIQRSSRLRGQRGAQAWWGGSRGAQAPLHKYHAGSGRHFLDPSSSSARKGGVASLNLMSFEMDLSTYLCLAMRDAGCIRLSRQGLHRVQHLRRQPLCVEWGCRADALKAASVIPWGAVTLGHQRVQHVVDVGVDSALGAAYPFEKPERAHGLPAPPPSGPSAADLRLALTQVW